MGTEQQPIKFTEGQVEALEAADRARRAVKRRRLEWILGGIAAVLVPVTWVCMRNDREFLFYLSVATGWQIFRWLDQVGR